VLAASHAQSSRLATAAGQHGDVAGHRCPDPAHGARLDHEVAPTGLRRVRSPRTTTALPAGRPGCRHFERQRSRAVRGGRPSAAGRVAEGVQLPWPEPSTKVLSAVRGQLARAAAGRVAGSGVLPVVPVPAIGVPEHAARTSQAGARSQPQGGSAPHPDASATCTTWPATGHPRSAPARARRRGATSSGGHGPNRPPST